MLPAPFVVFIIEFQQGVEAKKCPPTNPCGSLVEVKTYFATTKKTRLILYGIEKLQLIFVKPLLSIERRSSQVRVLNSHMVAIEHFKLACLN